MCKNHRKKNVFPVISGMTGSFTQKIADKRQLKTTQIDNLASYPLLLNLNNLRTRGTQADNLLFSGQYELAKSEYEEILSILTKNGTLDKYTFSKAALGKTLAHLLMKEIDDAKEMLEDDSNSKWKVWQEFDWSETLSWCDSCLKFFAEAILTEDLKELVDFKFVACIEFYSQSTPEILPYVFNNWKLCLENFTGEDPDGGLRDCFDEQSKIYRVKPSGHECLEILHMPEEWSLFVESGGKR